MKYFQVVIYQKNIGKRLAVQLLRFLNYSEAAAFVDDFNEGNEGFQAFVNI